MFFSSMRYDFFDLPVRILQQIPEKLYENLTQK
jgi:hypothetical protein